MKILCCGIFPALQRTLELKTLKTGSVNRVRSVTQSVGGKATNAARVLHTLNANPLLFGFAGGESGELIKTLLHEENIEHAFVETTIPTRTAQTLLADDAHDFTELIEDCEPLPAKDWKSLLKQFHATEQQSDTLILSGTLPPHVPVEIYSELLRGTENKKVIIDSPGKPLLAALENQPTLVKINASELKNTTGIGDIEEAAKELMAQGAGAVGITQGADTAWLITPTQTTRFQIPEVEVKNTLGCGDAVNAGIAFALQKESALPEAFIFGLACGAANAQTALPGVIHPDQIAQLIPQIKIS
jgi:tagatose 6-phosphate kinase